VRRTREQDRFPEEWRALRTREQDRIPEERRALRTRERDWFPEERRALRRRERDWFPEERRALRTQRRDSRRPREAGLGQEKRRVLQMPVLTRFQFRAEQRERCLRWAVRMPEEAPPPEPQWTLQGAGRWANLPGLMWPPLRGAQRRAVPQRGLVRRREAVRESQPGPDRGAMMEARSEVRAMEPRQPAWLRARERLEKAGIPEGARWQDWLPDWWPDWAR
jgi:hypothetical protein